MREQAHDVISLAEQHIPGRRLTPDAADRVFFRRARREARLQSSRSPSRRTYSGLGKKFCNGLPTASSSSLPRRSLSSLSRRARSAEDRKRVIQQALPPALRLAKPAIPLQLAQASDDARPQRGDILHPCAAHWNPRAVRDNGPSFEAFLSTPSAYSVSCTLSTSRSSPQTARQRPRAPRYAHFGRRCRGRMEESLRQRLCSHGRRLARWVGPSRLRAEPTAPLARSRPATSRRCRRRPRPWPSCRSCAWRGRAG